MSSPRDNTTEFEDDFLDDLVPEDDDGDEDDDTDVAEDDDE